MNDCFQGRIQDFHLGGAKDYARTLAHYERETQSPFRQESRTRLRALEALGHFYARLCYMRLIFKHSDTKWDKKTIVNQSLGGGGHAPVAPPP